MKKFVTVIFVTLVVLYFMSKCDYREKYFSNTETIELEKNGLQINDMSKENQGHVEGIVPVNDILSKFQNWEGKKNSGDVIYTLNLDNDTYVLTIKPQGKSNQTLSWTDIYYFKDIDNGSITVEELKPMYDLASIISSHWNEEKLWIDKVINNELPYEEIYNNYTLSVDKYIYNGSVAGLYFKIVNNVEAKNYLTKEEILKQAYLEVNADKESAWIFAKDAVKENLKAPSTAKFPLYDESYITVLENGSYIVNSYVDAENSYGAKIRTEFSVKITIKGEYDYTYADLIID